MNAIHERGARLMGWNLEDVDKPFLAQLQTWSWRTRHQGRRAGYRYVGLPANTQNASLWPL